MARSQRIDESTSGISYPKHGPAVGPEHVDAAATAGLRARDGAHGNTHPAAFGPRLTEMTEVADHWLIVADRKGSGVEWDLELDRLVDPADRPRQTLMTSRPITST